MQTIGHTRRGRSRDGVFKGDKYKFWKLSQTTLFTTPTIRKLKRSRAIHEHQV